MVLPYHQYRAKFEGGKANWLELLEILWSRMNFAIKINKTDLAGYKQN